jgi:hypothetical protein
MTTTTTNNHENVMKMIMVTTTRGLHLKPGIPEFQTRTQTRIWVWAGHFFLKIHPGWVWAGKFLEKNFPGGSGFW